MFRIGQKVVCVDDTSTECVINGKIYTVNGIDGDFLLISDLEPKSIGCGMYRTRFRPVVGKKTDISVFEEILKRETVDDRAPAHSS